MIDSILFGSVWGLVIYVIWRGYQREQGITRYALLTWLVFISIAFVCTFRLLIVEKWFSNWFQGQPVAYVLNATFSLSAAVLYAISLMTLHTETQTVFRWWGSYKWLVRGGFVTGLLLDVALLASYRQFLTPEQAYYTMRLTLESYIFVLVILMLLPINWWLFRREQVLPMKIKLLAVMVGLVAYSTDVLVGLLILPDFLLTGHADPNFGMGLRVFVGAGCIVVILVPHRWLVAFLPPRRVWWYIRVVTVERHLAQLIAFRLEPFSWYDVFRPHYLEMAAYRAVINIMDNYRRLDKEQPAGQKLHQQLQELLFLHLEYDDLIHAISRMRL